MTRPQGPQLRPDPQPHPQPHPWEVQSTTAQADLRSELSSPDRAHDPQSTRTVGIRSQAIAPCVTRPPQPEPAPPPVIPRRAAMPMDLRDRLHRVRSRRPRLRDEFITLAHGSGGSAMRDLIAEVMLGAFGNPYLECLEDQARLDWEAIAAPGDRLALTTDSYVITPLIFPGGTIGTLAVNGTVNDLAVGGAIPHYLTCGFILEEGLPVATLRAIVASMREAAIAAGVQIVTGDTKVVPRGAADQMFINTAGVGVIPAGVTLSADHIQPGDAVLVNGTLGDHGAAIAVARGDLGLATEITSDCQPLHELTAALLAACPHTRVMRDATRGGLATVLDEFASAAGVAIALDELALPVREDVAGLCELLGLDPLYLANEGKVVAIVPGDAVEAALAAWRSHPAGRHAQVIGHVRPQPAGIVVLRTRFGAERAIERLAGDQLPRIC